MGESVVWIGDGYPAAIPGRYSRPSTTNEYLEQSRPNIANELWHEQGYNNFTKNTMILQDPFYKCKKHLLQQ